MKIALITDLHAEENWVSEQDVSSWDNWKITLDDIESRGIEEVIFLGDIGAPAAHQKFFDSLEERPFNYKVILGNHEDFEEVMQTKKPAAIQNRKAWYWSEEGEAYKSIFLDTSTDAISATQLDWLEAELQTDKSILLFVHHPILPTHTTPHLEFPLEGDQVIHKLLKKHPKPVHIFCGHLHLDDECVDEHIVQTVTPSASIQIKRHSEKAEVENIGFAYRLLDIQPDQIDAEVIWFDKSK
ncbi:MAG: metallophosphoesterase [Reichenbachiella sp.]|uniref:metallophosphoesterase family protein n=1 Tax=Reichenbachiella sp. TaxID=2184521 RepID=UPI0032990C86